MSLGRLEWEYTSREALGAAKTEQWAGIPSDFIDELWTAYENRWTPEFNQAAGTSAALVDLANQRLSILHGLLGEGGEER